MKTFIDIGPCYEKLVKEFIVNITAECNVEGNKECKMVYDWGKCMKLSPWINNYYLSRRNVSYINKIMAKEKKVKEEE